MAKGLFTTLEEITLQNERRNCYAQRPNVNRDSKKMRSSGPKVCLCARKRNRVLRDLCAKKRNRELCES